MREKLKPYLLVEVGDSAVHYIPHPDSDVHWEMRYSGKVEHLPCAVMVLESFDYLLCDEISMKEATRRLRLLRAARAKACLPNHQPSAGGEAAPLHAPVGQTASKEAQS